MINKKKFSPKILIIEIALIVALIAIDLLSKVIVFSFLESQPQQRFVVWEGIWTFILSKNYGASFGIFEGKQTFLLVLTITFTILMIAVLFYKQDTPKTCRIGLIMLIGGGIGNIVDRLAFGYVRDFIDYTFLKTFFGIDFAIGNIADVFLCIGVLLILVYVVFEFDEKDFMSKKKLQQIELKEMTENNKITNESDCDTTENS